MVCNKCRGKHNNVKCTHIQNNIEYVKNILAVSDTINNQRNFDNRTSEIHPSIQPISKHNPSDITAHDQRHTNRKHNFLISFFKKSD